MITIHMVIQNNQNTIQKAIDSVSSLNANFLFADIGCTDKTTDICKKYGEVIRVNFRNDLSAVRNELCQKQTEWNLQLEPWEEVLAGLEEIEDLAEGNYRCNIIQNTLITKPIRIWNKNKKIKYKNPVYEVIPGIAEPTGIYIRSTPPDMVDKNLELLEIWKNKNPIAFEYHYYKACIFLTQNKWKEFIDLANHFLFQEKKMTMASIMTRYYMATVYCYVLKDQKKALELLMYCFAKKPLMAEFWCLLGDIYYETDEYSKAKCFYENAKILGSRRLNSDEWPFDISKYKDYPNKMIASCDEIISKAIKIGQVSKTSLASSSPA